MIQILKADGLVVMTLRVPGGQNNAALISGWKKRRVVIVRIVGVVDDEEPGMMGVGKPYFHLLKALSVCPTHLSEINEGLLCGLFAASIDPENAPETNLAMLDYEGCCVYLMWRYLTVDDGRLQTSSTLHSFQFHHSQL